MFQPKQQHRGPEKLAHKLRWADSAMANSLAVCSSRDSGGSHNFSIHRYRSAEVCFNYERRRAAIGVYSAIAAGMIALTGIVFSLAFVMVQFSATAYSPRLVLWIARDPVMSHALGIFTATFLYALTALTWVDRNNSGRVPLSSLWVVGVLLLASIAIFISLIHRIGMLQINRNVDLYR